MRLHRAAVLLLAATLVLVPISVRAIVDQSTPPSRGGTGTSTLPAYGKVLIGGKNGEYEFVASSTFGGGTAVSSFNGRTGAVTPQSGDYTTSLVTEGSNLYYTLLRFAAALAGTTTDALGEGVSNLYFTNARADSRFVTDLAATSSVSSITTLPSLSLPASQLSGTLGVSKGGTGSTTLTGILKGNGTSQIQSAVGNTDYQLPISLTTSGTSGAATFNGVTLNIPQYSGTTYTGTYPVQIAGSVISLAFGTTSSNTWGGTQTFTNTPVLGTLSGLIGANNGALYAIASSSNFVTSLAGTAQQIAVSASTGNVTLSLPSFLNLTSLLVGSASTTNATTTGSQYFTGLSGSGGALGIDANGKVYKAATTTAGTGLTYNSAGNFSVNTSQNISTLSNLTTNGFVITSGGTGALSIDTTSYTPTTRNITTTYPIQGGGNLSADRTLSLAFGTTTQNFWNAYNNFTSLFATSASTTNATTTGTAYFTGVTPSTILQLDANNKLTPLTVGSGLSFNGTTLSATGVANNALGTTSPWTQGQLAMVVNNSTVTGVSTSTPTVTAPITYSGTLGNFVGGSSGTFGCTNASAGVTGCLTGADWSTFNNKQATISATAPIRLSGTTLDFTGLSTTSQPSSSNVLTSNGTNGVYGSATSSLTASGLLGLSQPVNFLGSAASALSLTAGANTVLVNQTNATAVVTALATSTFGTGLYGFGTNGFVLAEVNGVPTWVATSSINNGVSSLAANSPITVSGSTGAVTISCVTCATTANQIATTTGLAVPQVAYFTKTGGITTLGGAATSSLTAAGVLSITNSPSILGSAGAVITLTGGANGQVLGWLNGAPAWTASSSVAAGTGISVSTSGAANTVTNTGVISASCSGGTTCSGTNPLSITSFAYPFAGNATTTLLQFNGGASSTALSANTLAVGGTGTTSISSTGALTIQSLTGLLKASSGLVSTAANGTDFTLITAKDCTGIGHLVSVTAAGVFACTADAAGGGGGGIGDPFTHPAANQSATTSLLLFNRNASSTQLSSTVAYFGGTATTTFLANGFVGLGSTTPWAQLSINPDVASGAAPAFAIGSSSATSFIVSSTGFVGIGTTSPWGNLSIAMPGITDYSKPIFTAATSSDIFGQLVSVFASTTSKVPTTPSIWSDVVTGVRVGIGGISQFGFGGILDQLFVNGRINTGEWTLIECVPGGVSAAVSSATNNICGPYYFSLSSAGTYTPAGTTNVGYEYAKLTQAAATVNGNAALFSNGPSAVTILSSTTPVFETAASNFSLGTNAVGTSTRFMGFTDSLTAPVNGCYFTASSTAADWIATCSSSGVKTQLDTNVSSSTVAFTRFRIETGVSDATFYVQKAGSGMIKVGTISTNYPATLGLRPTMMIKSPATARTGAEELDFTYLRVWQHRGLYR